METVAAKDGTLVTWRVYLASEGHHKLEIDVMLVGHQPQAIHQKASTSMLAPRCKRSD
jgi:hypothetical protein